MREGTVKQLTIQLPRDIDLANVEDPAQAVHAWLQETYSSVQMSGTLTFAPPTNSQSWGFP